MESLDAENYFGGKKLIFDRLILLYLWKKVFCLIIKLKANFNGN